MRYRLCLPILLLLALASPASADLKVVSVFGTPGSNPGELAGPSDVTTDSAGNVYVSNTSNARVDKYTADGAYLMSFGARGSAPGQLGLPLGVAVAPSGQVWVSDNDGSRGRITVYDADGSLVRTFGSVGTGDGQFRSPGPIALDAAGNAYVVDTSNQRVQKFSPDGVFITKWGSQGSADGQFNNPRGITVEPSGNVLVADRDNRRVQRFSPDGAFIGKFGTPATKDGNFSSVYDVFAASNGDIFTADNNLFDLEQFTSAGAFVFQANPKSAFDGTAAAGLRPVAVTAAPDGTVYAVGTQGNPVFVAKLQQVAPQPVLAQTATAAAVKGRVLVKAPGAANFTPLTKGTASIPIGSTVDASKGTVKLQTATGVGVKIQSGAFNGGAFKLNQAKKNKGLTELVLQGGPNFKHSCSKKPARAAAKRGRQLFADAHGHFRTRGRYSTATVRGTKWLTKDTCAGTRTSVMRGAVQVRDLVKRRNVLVKAHHSYLAAPLKK